MLAAIYARYSSENQRPESIEDQVTACRRLAGQRGFTIVEEHILWLPKTPSDLKTQGFQPFVRLWWLPR